jgi:integrase
VGFIGMDKDEKNGKPKHKKMGVYHVQPLRSQKEIKDMKWALKRFCGQRDYILFLLGINTGLRISDLVKLKAKDLKKKKQITVREGKTEKTRKLYLENIYKELNSYLNTIESEYAFPSRKGSKHITPTQAYRQLIKAGGMADLENIGTHTMRKTFGYWHYKQFKDIAQLQMILNHDRPTDTLKYIGITEEEIENSMRGFKL